MGFELDDPVVEERLLNDGHSRPVAPDDEHAGLGRQAAIDRPVVEERRGVDVVVPRVRVDAVRPGESGVPAEDQPVRVGAPKIGPRHGRHRVRHERFAGQMANHGSGIEVRPEALGLAVVHDHRRVEQTSRRTEVENAVAESTVVRERRVAKWAIRDRDGDIADGVVDELVPSHDLERIGPSLATDLEGENRFGLSQPIDRACVLEPRGVDRRDPIGRGAARANLVQVDERFRKRGVRPVVERARHVLSRR